MEAEGAAAPNVEAQAASSPEAKEERDFAGAEALDPRGEGTSLRDAESADLSAGDFSSDGGGSDGGADALPEEKRLEVALECKVSGNALFKDGDFGRALETYKKGVGHVKRLTGSEATALSVQLNSNSCLCCLRLEKWDEAVKCADAVIAQEPRNVKALFRRAVGLHNVGRLEEARESLVNLLAVDKNNLEARRELSVVKEKISLANKRDRKAYTNIFSRAGGLYNDREAEREQRRQREEEERRKREPEWKKEMEARKKKGEAEVTFEEWLEKKKEEEDRKIREKQREHSQNTPAKTTKKQTSKSSQDGAEEMELDEEDKAIINETKKMGYCYFRRNLTEEEKQLNARNLPVKINPDAALNHTPQAQSGASQDGAVRRWPTRARPSPPPSSEGRSISQWNSKGTTYEEKDVSAWARTRFSERLLEAEVSVLPENGLLPSMEGASSGDPTAAMAALLKSCLKFRAKATKVDGVSGDVHLAVVRGTRRVFFELKCTIEFSIEATGSFPELQSKEMEGLAKGFSCKGTLSLPEVSSADGSGMEWLRGSTVKLDEMKEFRGFESGDLEGCIRLSGLESARRRSLLNLQDGTARLCDAVTQEIVNSFKECVAQKIQAFLDDCKALS